MPTQKLVQDSQTNVTKKDQEQIDSESILERNWHKTTPRYQTNEDISEAYRNKKLIKVGITKNYRPITRLLNPDTDIQYPPYLKKKAKKTLDKLAKNWRRRVRREFGKEYDRVLLPVTFLVCSEEYKQELLNTPGKILNSEGTHSTGFTFDIDASSYYLKDGVNYYSVADPRRNKTIIEKNKKNLIEIGGSKLHTLSNDEPYNKRLTDILLEESEKLFRKGKINLIVEYRGTQNQCLHICVKP